MPSPQPAGATPPDILALQGVSLSFGGVRALAGVDLTVPAGSITGIIGPNGAGKTSVLNCVIGFHRPQQGSIRFNGRDLSGVAPDRRAAMGIARTFQNIALFEGMTVLDNIKRPRLLLLDERVAGMNEEETEDMARFTSTSRRSAE